MHYWGRMPNHYRRSFAGKLRHLRFEERPKAPARSTCAPKFANRFPGQSFAQLPSPEEAKQKLNFDKIFRFVRGAPICQNGEIETEGGR